MLEAAVMVLGTLAALGAWAATVAWQRLGLAERALQARRRTVRALSDLLAGRG